MNLSSLRDMPRRLAEPPSRRLRTWWYGYDIATAPIAIPVPIVEHSVKTVEQEKVNWAKVAQRIWGEGYLQPGGPDYLLNLVKPLNVNPAHSLLDLSAGLGGPTRHIATAFDVYITGFERSVEIAAQGQQLSVKAGLGRKVPISSYDPEHFELRPGAFDGILGQYLTSSVQNKERFFAQVKQALKPRGQFTFTDYVIVNASADDPRLRPWVEMMQYPVYPWKPDQYTALLNSIGLNCRVVEDQSDTFRQLVTAAWREVIAPDKIGILSKPVAAALFAEGSKYLSLLKLMDDKLLAFYRFYAVLK